MAIRLKDRIEANIRQSDKVNHSLSINGKTFDGSTTVNVGAIGAAYGGTGQTSLINSSNALINSLTVGDDIPIDQDYYISQYVGGGNTNTTYHRRQHLALYNYIKTRAEGVWNIAANSLTHAVTTIKDQETLDAFRGASAGLRYAAVQGPLTGLGNDDALMIAMSWPNHSTAAVQLVIDDAPDSNMWFRGSASGGVWGAWHTVLHNNNYTSYTVKKDGTGASGTWGINISGEASWTKQLKYQSNLTTIDNINAFHTAGTCRIACVSSDAGLDIGLSGKDGILISVPWNHNAYGAQFLVDDNSSGTVFIRGMDNGTWGSWHKFLHSGNYTTYFNPSNYVLKTGDTMTGKLQVNNVIVGYNYGNAGNNAAVFVFDKPGSAWTGFGPKQDSDGNAQSNTIHFGPCDSSGNWATEPFQRWMFYGDIYAGGGNDSCGIHPWINNYSTLGRENLYWWKAYVSYVYSNQVTGAVWNDYAEYRAQNETLIAGYIAYCDDDGKLKYTTERLQKFEGVVSDTFGFSIGETDECKTPLAVSGRALVYCDHEDHFHSGDCVCAGPDGKAYRMTREEVTMYPDRIVGVVSEIPTYERWGTGNVEVNGRIWIKVK